MDKEEVIKDFKLLQAQINETSKFIGRAIDVIEEENPHKAIELAKEFFEIADKTDNFFIKRMGTAMKAKVMEKQKESLTIFKKKDNSNDIVN